MNKGYSIDQVLSLKQSTILAPQLQQGVHLLQLSSLELQTEIETALETNPFLEKLELGFDIGAENPAFSALEAGRAKTREQQSGSTTLIHGFSPASGMPAQTQTNSTAGQRSQTEGEGGNEMMLEVSDELSLQTYLLQQARSTPLAEQQHFILELLIDSVNDNGYLRASNEDIIQLAMPDYVVTSSQVSAMIQVLHDFEPVGVGARTASECLLLQLRDRPANTPGLDIARLIAKRHLLLLAQQKIQNIAVALGLAESELNTPIALIRQLNPFPGSVIASKVENFIAPDLVVKKVADQWVVRLNPNVAPAVCIHNESMALLELARGKKGYRKLKQEMQNAQSLLSNLEKRYRTLLQVARIIVERQNKYFDNGEVALTPLAQKDIAAALEVHVSTVSRAVNDKFLLAPGGVIELRYFFSSAILTIDGETISSKAIQAKIANMIGRETPRKPLSDQSITAILNEQGIRVARRTVSKYRERANIMASPKRRRAALLTNPV